MTPSIAIPHVWFIKNKPKNDETTYFVRILACKYVSIVFVESHFDLLCWWLGTLGIACDDAKYTYLSYMACLKRAINDDPRYLVKRVCKFPSFFCEVALWLVLLMAWYS